VGTTRLVQPSKLFHISTIRVEVASRSPKRANLCSSLFMADFGLGAISDLSYAYQIGCWDISLECEGIMEWQAAPLKKIVRFGFRPNCS
jgi:hypothetical protein